MERTKIGNPILVKCVCPMCKTESYVMVGATDYANWQNGELAQNAFPYLSLNDRERLISGICPKCWDKMFGVGVDED